MKKIYLLSICCLLVSCTSIEGFIKNIITIPDAVEAIDKSPKDEVTTGLISITILGTYAGFIVALLAGVASVYMPSKRLGGLAFLAALIGFTCLLCVWLMPFLNYIVWVVIASLLAWGLYQLYRRHYEGKKYKDSQDVIKDLSRRFEDVAGRKKLGDKARIQLAIHEGEVQE